MVNDGFVHILVAEDNDVSRDLMTAILRAQGFKVWGAIDGDSAARIVENRHIDLALVDINMSPKSGFEFIRYLLVRGLKIPVIIVTGDDTSDMLVEARLLDVEHVLQKPVEPDRLLKSVHKILKERGFSPASLAVERHDTQYTPEELMQKALDLALENARTKKGGPFGAIVANARGEILGTGVSGLSARIDPTACAEVMAIRKAAEKLGQYDLEGCILYCSSQPTKIGQAVISSVGITQVFYGLSHADIGKIQKPMEPIQPHYEQLSHDSALEMFMRAKNM